MKQVGMQLQDPVDTFFTSRESDKMIMKQFYDAGIRGHTLYILNICRLKCEALTLTDITTGDVTMIRKSSWNVQPDFFATANHDWPRAPMELPKDWVTIWRNQLLQTFGLRNFSATIRLEIPLGDWKGKGSDHWKMRHKDNMIFYKDGNQWRRYQRTRNTRNAKKYNFMDIKMTFHRMLNLPQEK